MIDIHIINKSKRLDPLLVSISSSLEDSLNKIKKVLPIEDVDIVVEDSPDRAIPETGIGGEAPTPYIVHISIDPLSANLVNIEKEIKSTLAHELHHCVRMREVGYGKTLLEALITEGLADHFDIEVNNSNPNPWSTALNQDQISELLKKAEKDFDNREYNHSDWFFGRKDLGIPRWTGYSLGYYLVSKYIQKNSGTTAAQLYKRSAENFRVIL